MKRILIATAIALSAVAAFAGENTKKSSLKADLAGSHEVPAVSTTGSGELVLRIVDDTSIEFELRYTNLEGTVTTASHVHLGQTSVNGGVMFFLCGGGGRSDCTPRSGTFTGTVTAADILGPAGQGISTLELEEALTALRTGLAYVNVHTNKHPSGEIRGQIH